MNHKELEVWKCSMDLVSIVYALTASFPKDELYGLTSQMKRAVISIPSNIAEGSARKSNKEFLQFIMIALESLAELETQYLIAIQLKFTSKDENIITAFIEQRRLLLGFRNHIKKTYPITLNS